MLHTDLAKAFARTFKQQSIWVYDKGVLLSEGRSQPFTSFMSATPYGRKQLVTQKRA